LHDWPPCLALPVYLPEHFTESRLDELHDIIRQHPFGMLVTRRDSGLDADHLPFELDAARGPFGTLLAHIARDNPLSTAVSQSADAMVVFRGPDGYISPNWYPSKQETQRHVPTWNYEVVHAHGRLRIVDDERFVRGVVARLTRRHEAAEPHPWKMSDAPADYLDAMLQRIVGIEVEITRLEGKRKLGQNRERRDVDGAIEALRERGSMALASAMERARGGATSRPKTGN